MMVVVVVVAAAAAAAAVVVMMIIHSNCNVMRIPHRAGSSSTPALRANHAIREFLAELAA